MEEEETEEIRELTSVSCSLLLGLALRGVLRAGGLCWKGQRLDALWGLPTELKVAERISSPPSDSHPLMSCLLWSLSDVMHLATCPEPVEKEL